LGRVHTIIRETGKEIQACQRQPHPSSTLVVLLLRPVKHRHTYAHTRMCRWMRRHKKGEGNGEGERSSGIHMCIAHVYNTCRTCAHAYTHTDTFARAASTTHQGEQREIYSRGIPSAGSSVGIVLTVCHEGGPRGRGMWTVMFFSTSSVWS